MRILRWLASNRKHAQTSMVAVEAKPVAGTLPTHSRKIPFHHTFKNPPPLDILATQSGIRCGGLIERPVQGDANS